MEVAAPSVEQMFQQLLDNFKTLENRSIETNTRLDMIVERVAAIELAQSMTVYPDNKDQVDGSNPLSSRKGSAQQSKESSPFHSDEDEKASSLAQPGTAEDLAAVLAAVGKTPSLKRGSVPAVSRRDSYYVRQLSAEDNESIIKYHEKSPDMPDTLKKISYRSVLDLLEALLDYEHRHRLRLPLDRNISQSCIDQILSRFNISAHDFHQSTLPEILTYLSTICTPSTRQQMTNFIIAYSKSLCNVTKVPTASNISYFVHTLQEFRRKMMQLLEFISFDPKSVHFL